MKLTFKLVLFAICIGFTFSFAQNADAYKIYADSLTNVPVKMDFSKSLSGINDPGLVFSHFKDKPLLIYYFSPKCPHCRNHFPAYQKIAKDFENKGVNCIGISIGGNIKKNDIRMFIDQFDVSIPIFQDSDMVFGPVYGTGYVPVMFLVLPDGTFFRYDTVKEQAFEHAKQTLFNLVK